MALDKRNFIALITVGFGKFWTYKTEDSIQTVVTPSYFDELYDILTPGDRLYIIQVTDLGTANEAYVGSRESVILTASIDGVEIGNANLASATSGFPGTMTPTNITGIASYFDDFTGAAGNFAKYSNIGGVGTYGSSSVETTGYSGSISDREFGVMMFKFAGGTVVADGDYLNIGPRGNSATTQQASLIQGSIFTASSTFRRLQYGVRFRIPAAASSRTKGFAYGLAHSTNSTVFGLNLCTVGYPGGTMDALLLQKTKGANEDFVFSYYDSAGNAVIQNTVLDYDDIDVLYPMLLSVFFDFNPDTMLARMYKRKEYTAGSTLVSDPAWVQVGSAVDMSSGTYVAGGEWGWVAGGQTDSTALLLHNMDWVYVAAEIQR